MFVVPYFQPATSLDHLHLLCFLLDRRLFGFNNEFVYMCAYVPPENYPYYLAFDIDDEISLLEESLADIMFIYSCVVM